MKKMQKKSFKVSTRIIYYEKIIWKIMIAFVTRMIDISVKNILVQQEFIPLFYNIKKKSHQITSIDIN